MTESVVNKIFNYIEKILSPYQFWLTILLVSAILLWLPPSFQADLGLNEIISSIKGYLSIIVLISLIVLIIKILSFVFNGLKNYESVDGSFLNSEEKAILCFFVNNQLQGANLIEKHPSVVSLQRRKFITIPKSPAFFAGGSEFDYFVLTKLGKKKLTSNGFQNEIFKDINQDRVLKFINSISREQYSTYKPESFD